MSRPRKYPLIHAPCACGCGGIPKSKTSKYLPGHHPSHTPEANAKRSEASKKMWATSRQSERVYPEHCLCGCGGVLEKSRTKYLPGHYKRKPPTEESNTKRSESLKQTFKLLKEQGVPKWQKGHKCPLGCECYRHKRLVRRKRTEEEKKKESARVKAKFEDPEYRAKRKAFWDAYWTPERRLAWSEKHKQVWSDAALLQQHSEILSDPELRQRRLETMIERYGREDGPTKNTIPERLIEELLKQSGLKYVPQEAVHGVSVDFFLPDTKVCVFVDGCWWHGHGCGFKSKKPNPDAATLIRRDNVQTLRLESLGFKVVRLHECKIRNRKDECLLSSKEFEELIST